MMKNYPDYFSSTGQQLVKKKSDGKFITLSEKEFIELSKAGKINMEIPKAKGGKFQDLTQRPTMVLLE